MSKSNLEVMKHVTAKAGTTLLELLNEFKADGTAEMLPAPAVMSIVTAVALENLKISLELAIETVMASDLDMEDKAAEVVGMLDALRESAQSGVNNLPTLYIGAYEDRPTGYDVEDINDFTVDPTESELHSGVSDYSSASINPEVWECNDPTDTNTPTPDNVVPFNSKKVVH